MKSDKVDVILHVSGADEGSYVLGDGTEKKYTEGTIITVGDQLKAGDSIKLTVSAVNKDGFTSAMSYLFTKAKEEIETTIADGMTVYFEKPSTWGEQLFAYIYSEKDGALKILKDWPGTEMQQEEDGKYSFTFSKEWSDGLIMFSDGTNQYPGANEAGLSIEENQIYSQ
jgi:alpha-amylase